MQNAVLIVDDEPGIRDTLRGVLEDEGFAVLTVATGEECLDAARDGNFACILLDIWLGDGIDGLETLAQLKEEDCDAAVVQRVAGIELGSTHGFAGFLGSQRNGRGIVFHVTELD